MIKRFFVGKMETLACAPSRFLRPPPHILIIICRRNFHWKMPFLVFLLKKKKKQWLKLLYAQFLKLNKTKFQIKNSYFFFFFNEIRNGLVYYSFENLTELFLLVRYILLSISYIYCFCYCISTNDCFYIIMHGVVLLFFFFFLFPLPFFVFFFSCPSFWY